MEEFRRGMANMYLGLECPGGSLKDAARQARARINVPTAAAAAAAAATTGSSSKSSYSARSSRHHAQRRNSAEVGFSGGCLLADEQKRDAFSDGVASRGWRRGPLDPAGNLLDLSDRNLLCASVRDEEAVFGSADHAVYCVDLSRGVKTRQLYGSRSKPSAGHKEWVTAVCHTAHGDIASGGMDGKLCLWPRGGGHPGEVQAHAGSIAAMKADAEGRVVTSGYGGALRIWDCRGGGRGGAAPRMSGEISDRGLPAPCMDFAWSGRRAMTGHRDGRVGIFDLETGAIVAGGCKGQAAHRGHVTVVKALSGMNGGGAGGGSGTSGCVVTGGQDGFVRIWDPRVGGVTAAALEAPAHRGSTGVGAVGDVIAAGTGGNRLVSFGADKRVCVLEVRGGRSSSIGGALDNSGRSSGHGRRVGSAAPSSSSPSSLALEHVFDDHRDFIYCMDFVPAASDAAQAGSGGGGGGGGVLITGGGDGMLLAHDLDSMRLLYGLGCCSAGAVRCAVAQGSRLTVAGDDGNAMLYSFERGNLAVDSSQWHGK
eukprot:g14716.t1